MAETSANAASDKPKAGQPYTDTVIRPTTAFDVRKPADLEEAGKMFRDAAKKNGVTLADEIRLVKINHRVGKSAEYTFEGTTK